MKQATHSALASDLGQRLYFTAESNPKDARLQIKSVKLADGGVYRCRVDFFNAATRNIRVNLSLVGKCNFPLRVHRFFFVVFSFSSSSSSVLTFSFEYFKRSEEIYASYIYEVQETK